MRPPIRSATFAALALNLALAAAALPARAADADAPPDANAQITELASLSVHEDAPAVRWLTLARDPSALQRLVALDELARAARFDSRAASLVRILADADADQRVILKAADLVERLPQRMTAHLRRTPVAPNGNSAATATPTASDTRTVVRIGWKQYPADELDIFAATLNHLPDDPAAARAVALAHGLNPAAGPTTAFFLAAGDTRWADAEPALVALGRIGVRSVAAVSTTAAGLTPDHANLAIPPAAPAPPPADPVTLTDPAAPAAGTIVKVVLEVRGGDLAIRVVGLSDPQPTPAALARVLRSLLRSPGNPLGPFGASDPVVVDPGDEVHWLDLVESLNAIAAAGYTNVALASVQGRPTPPGPDAIDPNALRPLGSPAPVTPDTPDTPDTALNTIDDHAAPPPDAVVLFDRDLGRTASVVYVVDASGSMIDAMPMVLESLGRSIDRLPDGTRYNIVFYAAGQPVETPPRGMLVASPDQRRRTRQWISPAAGHVKPVGRTDPTAALALAFAYKPDLIVLVSDNLLGRGVWAVDHDTLLTRLAAWNPHQRTRVSTVQLLYPDPLDTLQHIARGTRGRHVFLSAPALGLPRTPPARDEPAPNPPSPTPSKP